MLCGGGRFWGIEVAAGEKKEGRKKRGNRRGVSDVRKRFESTNCFTYDFIII